MSDITQIQQLLREAVAHHRAARLQQAEQLYREVLALQPAHADALQLLGVIANETGRHDEAIELISAAIRIASNIVGWHVNLGAALRGANRLDEAIAALQRAIALDPNNTAAHFNLANVLTQAKRLDDALVEYRAAAMLSPNDPMIQRTLTEALYEQGDMPAAIAASERATQLHPPGNAAIRARLFDATMVPAVYESTDKVQLYRQRVIDKIRALHEEHARYVLDRSPQTLFRLAYQGFDDREIMRDYGSLMVAPEMPAPVRRSIRSGERIRIGFISSFFRNFTAGRLRIAMVEKFSREKFEVVVLSVGSHQGEIADRYRAAADRFVVLPTDLAAARKLIADQQLDLLYYTDIGMDSTTYALAFSRLAPVQCVTWAHPVTTGIPTLDYFISSEWLEDAPAQSQYTERLVRLKSYPIRYERPVLRQPARQRADFGLPADATLYGCLQSLFKMHPEFDAILGQILRRDRRGVLLLIEGNSPRWRQLLMARFARTMPDVIDQIHWLPKLAGPDFLNVAALCDVMLDPIHFGGCTTSFESFAVGVPVITLPAPLLRGRFTQAFYRMMEITDCTASSPEQYIDLAVRFGTNRDLRREVGQKILERCDVIFNDAGVRDLEDFLARAARGAIE